MPWPDLKFMEPESEEWHAAWAALKAEWGDTVQECPDTGECWQYMGTERHAGKWYWTFRHRNQPSVQERVYSRYPRRVPRARPVGEDLDALREQRAGCVSLKRRQRTGTVVGIYRAKQAHLCDEAGPWVAVCEDHGATCGFLYRRDADFHAVAPDGWCVDCQKLVSERALSVGSAHPNHEWGDRAKRLQSKGGRHHRK